MDEIWKEVPGYEGIYEVSSLGRVRTAEGKTTWSTRFQKQRVWKQRVLKQKLGKRNGGKMDARVGLYRDGESKTFLVSRLVCAAFLGVAGPDCTVNHKDGDTLNNSIDNLEYLSLAENIRHAFRTGLSPCCSSVELIRADGGDTKKFRSMREASAYIGRNQGYLHNCRKTGRTPKSRDGIAYIFRTEV